VATLHVLRVFLSADGTHGNPLGVFLAGDEIPADRRQSVARDLGFAETVFVDDQATGRMDIFTPGAQLPFAGHPTVGTAWLLAREGAPVASLRPSAGEVAVRYEDDLTWVAARPEWSPPFEYVELSSPSAVDALDGVPEGKDLAYCWAWEDEGAGRVRARSFVGSAGIPEDEATGSAALALGARLGRPIGIRQGEGSQLFAGPLDDGLAEVGGRCVLDETREYEL
jgi:predicted PhzF superfamily epimerase YddE/YHI9